MTRCRITSVPVLMAMLCLVATVVAGLGTLVALWAPRATAAVESLPPRTCTPARPCLAVVIDDVGRDITMLRRLLSLRLPLTFSVLPHARHTRQSVAAIREQGGEIMLHLPMAPLDPQKLTDEVVVLGNDGPLGEAFEACARQVPGAVGVNNHMGSRVSGDPRVITRILHEVGHRSLWFLDSRTTPDGLFCRTACRLGVSCLERDLFLDDPPRDDAIRARLSQAMHLARSRGWSVVIGHPRKGIVDALQTYRVQTGIDLVPLSAVVGSVKGCHLTGQDTGT